MAYKFLSLQPINPDVAKRIQSYKDTKLVSGLNVWVKITSGAGLTIVSNPNIPTFGVDSIHGSLTQTAPAGLHNFDGSPNSFKTGTGDIGYKPRPIIENIEVSYGNSGLSKKVTFDIITYTREQTDIISQYFLEPGFHVAVEWGWNVAESYAQLTTTPSSIADLHDYDKLTEKRKRSNYTYDGYVGIITGGGITYSDTTFKVSVSLTGIGEVMAELQSQRGGETKKGEGDDKDTGFTLRKTTITADELHSFIEMFNALPDAYRTRELAESLTGNSFVLNRTLTSVADGNEFTTPSNYINFLTDTVTDLNKQTRERNIAGRIFGRVFGTGTGTVTTEDGEKAIIPSGAGMVDPARFIRFGTFIDIINSISKLDYEKGIKLGSEVDKSVPININIKKVPISAFQYMFSTNGDRLFIPSTILLDFGLQQSVNETGDASTRNIGANRVKSTMKASDNGQPLFLNTSSLPWSDNGIRFPETGPLLDNENGLKTDPFKWGYLENLYINFDFAVSVLERTGVTQKDFLLDLLNGMSSAVNNLWDFKITEDLIDNTILRLSVVDQNFIGFETEEPPKFIGNGEKSSFQSFGFDVDMPKAMMSQVIGKRLSGKGNTKEGYDSGVDLPPVSSTLFSTDKVDQVAPEIELKQPSATQDNQGGGEGPSDEDIIKENFEYFMRTGTIVTSLTTPVKINNRTPIFDTLFVAAWNDTTLFNHLRHFPFSEDKGAGISPLLPIKTSFSTFGVSGIDFGNTYKIVDAPEKYQEGLWQIREITHSISGMSWKTSITGQYRQLP